MKDYIFAFSEYVDINSRQDRHRMIRPITLWTFWNKGFSYRDNLIQELNAPPGRWPYLVSTCDSGDRHKSSSEVPGIPGEPSDA